MPQLHLVDAAGVWTANGQRQNLPFGKVVREQLVFGQHFIVHRTPLSRVAAFKEEEHCWVFFISSHQQRCDNKRLSLRLFETIHQRPVIDD